MIVKVEGVNEDAVNASAQVISEQYKLREEVAEFIVRSSIEVMSKTIELAFRSDGCVTGRDVSEIYRILVNIYKRGIYEKTNE